jgi:hypothetical protein
LILPHSVFNFAAVVLLASIYMLNSTAAAVFHVPSRRRGQFYRDRAACFCRGSTACLSHAMLLDTSTVMLLTYTTITPLDSMTTALL